MIDEKALAESIENFGSGLANVGLLATASQTVWPIPGFVIPHGLVTTSFWCAWGGVGLRTMAKPIAGFLVAMATLFSRTPVVRNNTPEPKQPTIVPFPGPTPPQPPAPPGTSPPGASTP